jgi:endonuclease/exonuclease/phosphatase (EEP) superfamily protein YafD
MGRNLRVVSWNVAFRVGQSPIQAAFLASLSPRADLILFQEVNRRVIDSVCEVAGMAWVQCSVDLREPDIHDTPVRRRGVAVAGRTGHLLSAGVLDSGPLPEQALTVLVDIDGIQITMASYHAPPGVSWFEKKPAQAVAFAHELSGVEGPALFGADANTPLIDAVDFALTRTHWQTGTRKLKGAPGDDLLFGPTKIHELDDALRRFLESQPAELSRLRVERPDGPLALSYRTGKRKAHPGTDRRFDSIWVSRHFSVDMIGYPYDASIAAGSDHAAVIADLSIETPAPNK